MRRPSQKKRRAKMEAWARSPEGKAFLRRFRYRTPEDAEALRKIQARDG